MQAGWGEVGEEGSLGDEEPLVGPGMIVEQAQAQEQEQRVQKEGRCPYDQKVQEVGHRREREEDWSSQEVGAAHSTHSIYSALLQALWVHLAEVRFLYLSGPEEEEGQRYDSVDLCLRSHFHSEEGRLPVSPRRHTLWAEAETSSGTGSSFFFARNSLVTDFSTVHRVSSQDRDPSLHLDHGDEHRTVGWKAEVVGSRVVLVDVLSGAVEGKGVEAAT